MKTHLFGGEQRMVTVCGVKHTEAVVISAAALLITPEPCVRCLEWVMEQGQLAARRLDALYIEVNSKE